MSSPLPAWEGGHILPSISTSPSGAELLQLHISPVPLPLRFVQKHVSLLWAFRLLQGMLKTPEHKRDVVPTPFPEGTSTHRTMVPSRATAPPPCSESVSLPTQDATQHTSAPCSSPDPKNRAGDTSQPVLTHVGLTMMPCGPCPEQLNSASHLQQQTRAQLQLFPLQHPTLSLPARLETRAHKHNQEKQFSFGASKLSHARSSGLGWPSPATAAAKPSPPSCLCPPSTF